MSSALDLNTLSAEQLRALVVERDAQIEQVSAQLKHHKLREQQLTHELALLKHYTFGKRAEGLNQHQRSLLDEHIDENIAALDIELKKNRISPPGKIEKASPKRRPLPPELPRITTHHEPDSTICPCDCHMNRMGEDINEKLDYAPGTVSVEQHVRGKWVCKTCETLVQEPVAPHIIDKGIPDHEPPGTGADLELRRPPATLLASTDLCPFWSGTPSLNTGRLGGSLWCGTDATGGTITRRFQTRSRTACGRNPGIDADNGQETSASRVYLGIYATTRFVPIQGVVYDFQESRAGKAARHFFRVGKASWFVMTTAAIKPVSSTASQTIGLLYEIEREAYKITDQARQHFRQENAKPVMDKLRQWLMSQREQVTNGTGTAKAVDYSLKRWEALICYLDDGAVPIDNNWVENQIRPWALGRSNWLFAGSLRSGQRAAHIMSLIQSAKINQLDPQNYLKDVMERLQTIKPSEHDLLLPHNWKQPVNVG